MASHETNRTEKKRKKMKKNLEKKTLENIKEVDAVGNTNPIRFRCFFFYGSGSPGFPWFVWSSFQSAPSRLRFFFCQRILWKLMDESDWIGPEFRCYSFDDQRNDFGSIE